MILSPFLHFRLCFEEKNKQLPSISFSYFFTFILIINLFTTTNLPLARNASTLVSVLNILISNPAFLLRKGFLNYHFYSLCQNRKIVNSITNPFEISSLYNKYISNKSASMRFKVSFRGFGRKFALLKYDKVNISSQRQTAQICKHVYEENQSLYKHLGTYSVFTLHIQSWARIDHGSCKEKRKLQVKVCLLMLPVALLCIALMIMTVDDCLHPMQRYNILKVTSIYIVLSLHQIRDLVAMRPEKGIVPVLPTPTVLPLFKLC